MWLLGVVMLLWLAQVVFVFVVNRAIAARKRKPTEFSTLNIASTLNSLVPDVGFRFKHLKQLPKRQVRADVSLVQPVHFVGLGMLSTHT